MTITTNQQLGVIVMPEYLQSETVEAVLDRLQEVGVNAVATSPYVMEVANETTGIREPPIDAGAGKVRLLDRSLWGNREMFVRTSPSFEPDRALYDGLRYQPPQPSELTESGGRVIDDLIAAAHQRGMKVHFQIASAIPPGIRGHFEGPNDEDRPRMPDGTIPKKRVANYGCLASPHIIDYGHALIRDLCQRYPDLDGIRFDWPEYPPYSLDDVFVDFNDNVRRFAERREIDFEALRKASETLYAKLHGGLTNEDLAAVADGDTGRFVSQQLAELDGIREWLLLKALLSSELLAGFRQVMNEAGARGMELHANAFPPPWHRVSGFDFGMAGKVCQGISVKLYGMHWAMMLRGYGNQLLAANPGISESLLVRALLVVLDIEDSDVSHNLDSFHYPGPDEPHPGDSSARARKIAHAQAGAADCPVFALAHGYGPVDDFERRMRVAWNASPHGVWLNRYGYLSDGKLKVIGKVANPE